MASAPSVSTTQGAESARSGLDADALQHAVVDNLACLQARYPAIATPHDWYMALAYSVRDRMLERWVSTVQAMATRRSRWRATCRPNS